MKKIILPIILANIFLTAGQFLLTSQVAGDGAVTGKYLSALSELDQENAQLQFEISSLKSLSSVEQKASSLGLKRASLTYLPSLSVAQAKTP